MKKQQVLFLGVTFLAGSSLFSMEENKSPRRLNCSSEIKIKAIINKVEPENKRVSRENSPSQCCGWEGYFGNSGNLPREYAPSGDKRSAHYLWYAPYMPEK